MTCDVNYKSKVLFFYDFGLESGASSWNHLVKRNLDFLRLIFCDKTLIQYKIYYKPCEKNRYCWPLYNIKANSSEFFQII